MAAEIRSWTPGAKALAFKYSFGFLYVPRPWLMNLNLLDNIKSTRVVQLLLLIDTTTTANDSLNDSRLEILMNPRPEK